MQKAKTFTTKDLILASYLFANHCILAQFAQRFKEGYWEFEETPELASLVHSYHAKNATVDLLRYKDAERQLRRMIATHPTI